MCAHHDFAAKKTQIDSMRDRRERKVHKIDDKVKKNMCRKTIHTHEINKRRKDNIAKK